VGQQLAITAGIEQCRGKYAIVMDCDLQDPPEAIPLLWQAAEGGADIVFARRKTDHLPWARLLANRLYFRMLSWIAGWRFDGELGSFSLISRRVMDAFLQFQERSRHYLMILYAVGYESRTIEYERAARPIGESGYNLTKLLELALSGVMFSTTRLLHWVTYAGISLAMAGVLFALLLIVRWLFFTAAPGWTSLIVVQLVVGGILALCVGITGLYVGRVFEESRRRPLYFVQDRICQADLNESPDCMKNVVVNTSLSSEPARPEE
jgi:dolichol-phosphate mannosyltransferase